MNNYSVDAEEYLEFVHDVPVERLLQPDPLLVSFLGSIKLPMVIFTNGTRSHSERVLKALDIEPFFQGVCDLASTGYLGKPHEEAFYTAAGYLDCTPDRTIFIDDLRVNVEAGSGTGAFTVHVNGKDPRVGDLTVASIVELEPIFAAMPWYHGSRDS
jgi:putative hydrolase of the HAD superfamily